MQSVWRAFRCSESVINDKRTEATTQSACTSVEVQPQSIFSKIRNGFQKSHVIVVSETSIKNAKATLDDLVWLATLKANNQLIYVPGTPKVAIIKC